MAITTTKLDVKDITNGRIVNDTWVGTGIFDELLVAVNTNIELQYSKGRIKGTDYANVYLGAMQSVLQQSIQYSIAERETEARIDLIRQQILTEVENTTLVKAKAEEAVYTTNFVLPKQLEKLEEEIDLLQSQDLDVVKTTDVKERQAVIQEAQSSKDLALKDKDLNVKERQMVVQETKVADELLTTAKQRLVLDAELLLKAEQEKSMYTERVFKDKQTAKLGLDNVIKTQEEARALDPNYVYQTKYTV